MNICLNNHQIGEKNMTKQDLITHCLTYPAAYEDYPFDNDTTLIRHTSNRKMFALVDHLNGRLHITLKCEPMKADFLRSIYKDIIPGYHMNKKHWNTIYINGDVPPEEIYELIQHSYNLIKPKKKGTKQ